jgi:outer membrane cobalamin receptor
MLDATVRFVIGALVAAAAPCCLAAADDTELATEQSLFEELPIVVTASKMPEPIIKAPSVAYVITADQIERSGASTLADILKRIPGMRVSMRECSLLGSRGFTSDQNDKFVFLIDNVPITNIMQDGTYNFIDMPILSMVDRIEVIKGPGSTLWGSDATFGIIHIFTKLGESVGGLQTTFDYASNSDLAVGNVLYGNASDNGDYLFSLTYADSNGSVWGHDRGNSIYAWDGGTKETLVDQFHDGVSADDIPNPWTANSSPDGGDLTRIRDLSPSLELYGKVRVGDTTFKARVSRIAQAYLWDNVYDSRYTDAVMKHYYGEVEHVQTYSEDRTLATRLNVHGMQYERGVPTGYDNPEATVSLETMTETGIGAEALYSARVADKHNVVAGVKATRTWIGPSTAELYYIGDMSVVPIDQRGTYPLDQGYYITVDPAVDSIYGIYLEDSCDAADRLTLVGGVSYEYNDLREVGGKIMPRGAVIYTISNALSAKYAYNSGYQRPPAQKRFSRLYGHATKSENIKEHDVEFMYNRAGTRATLTGYRYKITDYFTWFDNRQYDPVTGDYVSGEVGHTNQGTAKGSGVELDLHQRLSDRWSIYANWAYADTTLNDSPLVGEPRYVYNLGADWSGSKGATVNLNVNGWRRMYHGDDPDGNKLYWSGSGEESVDLAVVLDNLDDRPLTLTVYAQNLLNNKIHVGMTGWPGYTYLPGVSVGARAAYRY